MFKRKIYDRLLQWKEESQGRTALMIEGARRVGKSTVAETFGKNEYDSYILIDFSIASQTVKDLFYDLSDLNFFFLQFQLLYRTDLIERRSLIIFDEVQLFPMARQAIKALVKDGRYDYIETGSLISIRKNVKDILIPSEERKISMYPMDYEEFLWAIGDETTTKLLRNAFSNRKAVGEQMNRKLMRDFRLYMLIGGMPQAVDEYLRTNNFRLVDQVKRDILNLYEDDFRKLRNKAAHGDFITYDEYLYVIYDCYFLKSYLYILIHYSFYELLLIDFFHFVVVYLVAPHKKHTKKKKRIRSIQEVKKFFSFLS